MFLFNKFSDFNEKRLPWLLLLLSCFSFLGAGFYFQYAIGLEPCHLCIIQRIAFLVIGIGALIALIKPFNKIFKIISNSLWLSGAGLGLYSGIKLVYTQMHPPELSFASGCSLSAEQLISNYPFLDWFPMMFEAKGSCSESSYSFLGIITMEQLTLVIFSVLLFLSVISFISIFRKKVNANTES